MPLSNPKNNRSTYERELEIPSRNTIKSFCDLLNLILPKNDPITPYEVETLFMDLAKSEATLNIYCQNGEDFLNTCKPAYSRIINALSLLFKYIPRSSELFTGIQNQTNYKGLRALVDAYERNTKPENSDENPNIIGTTHIYKLDSVEKSFTFEKIREFLTLNLRHGYSLDHLDDEEYQELIDLIVDLICPGKDLPKGFSTTTHLVNALCSSTIDTEVTEKIHSENAVMGRDFDRLVIFARGEYNRRIRAIVGDILDKNGLSISTKKSRVVRAAEGKKKRIDLMGVVFRNDGVERPGFTASKTIIKNIRGIISSIHNLESDDLCDVLTKYHSRGMGLFKQLLTNLILLHDIEYWGKPLGSKISSRKKYLLPNNVERMLKSLFVKIKFYEFGDEVIKRFESLVKIKDSDIDSSKERTPLEPFLKSTLKTLGLDLDFSEDGNSITLDAKDQQLFELSKENMVKVEGFPVRKCDETFSDFHHRQTHFYKTFTRDFQLMLSHFQPINAANFKSMFLNWEQGVAKNETNFDGYFKIFFIHCLKWLLYTKYFHQADTPRGVNADELLITNEVTRDFLAFYEEVKSFLPSPIKKIFAAIIDSLGDNSFPQDVRIFNPADRQALSRSEVKCFPSPFRYYTSDQENNPLNKSLFDF
ncbi:hypothetical protein ACFL21_00185 [Patescibacteria group bacterium]